MAATRPCAPCADCPPTTPPVMPRCEGVVLPDGSYSNATIVVENGCITSIETGSLQVYTPDACCPEGGGGTGGDGLDGPPGPPGQNATIGIGAVTSLAPGAAPTVENVGTPTAAILAFGIPRGADGADGEGAVSGVTSSTLNNTLVIENGLVKQIPAQWPPVMMVQEGLHDTVGAAVVVSEDPLTGVVTVKLEIAGFVTALTADFQGQIDALQALIDTQAGQMSALQTQLISLQIAVQACCPGEDLDLDGDGGTDVGGTPGVSPPPPVAPN